MNIKFKEYSCTDKDGNGTKYENNEIPLYIVMTRKCNTNCKFCEYHNGKSEIDVDKFEETFERLSKYCTISTVHFTGGEPTIEIDKLKQLCRIIKQKNSLIATSVNTNGTRLKELENIKDLDNISLSRHAINDVENQEIFRSKLVPTIEEINNFQDKHKIHLSCNMIKGYVDSYDKVVQYLELAAYLNINDVGLVGLMKINDYCNQHYIDFNNLDIKLADNLIKSRCFKNIDRETSEICCKCENYLYRASNMNFVSMYRRHAIKNNQISDYLVYENNELKQGFNGNKIELED